MRPKHSRQQSQSDSTNSCAEREREKKKNNLSHWREIFDPKHPSFELDELLQPPFRRSAELFSGALQPESFVRQAVMHATS